MVFPYRLDAVRKAAVVTCSGAVRGHDIAETMTAMYDDLVWQYGFDTLWDGTNVSELLFEKDDLAGFVRLQKQFAAVSGPGWDVIVAVRPIDRMIAHMYKVFSKMLSRKAHVAWSESEAWEILARYHPS